MAESTIVTQSKITSSSTTARGTKIEDSSGSLDKDAFLKILAAELTNQDPLSSNKDGTEYVAQMAQFSSLEQMANLNSSLKFSGATSLIGKTVMINSTNDEGNYYVGEVTGVSKDSGIVRVNVNVGKTTSEDGTETDEIKQFLYEDVIEVVDA